MVSVCNYSNFVGNKHQNRTKCQGLCGSMTERLLLHMIQVISCKGTDMYMHAQLLSLVKQMHKKSLLKENDEKLVSTT